MVGFSSWEVDISSVGISKWTILFDWVFLRRLYGWWTVYMVSYVLRFFLSLFFFLLFLFLCTHSHICIYIHIYTRVLNTHMPTLTSNPTVDLCVRGKITESTVRTVRESERVRASICFLISAWEQMYICVFCIVINCRFIYKRIHIYTYIYIYLCRYDIPYILYVRVYVCIYIRISLRRDSLCMSFYTLFSILLQIPFATFLHHCN